jgi:hypothetical protein
MMPGDEASGGMSMGYGTMGGTQNTLMPDMTAHDKPVEIFGVVYIYNPVDTKKLRLEEAAQASASVEVTASSIIGNTAGG